MVLEDGCLFSGEIKIMSSQMELVGNVTLDFGTKVKNMVMGNTNSIGSLINSYVRVSGRTMNIMMT
jgi:hypothetical protein